MWIEGCIDSVEHDGEARLTVTSGDVSTRYSAFSLVNRALVDRASLTTFRISVSVREVPYGYATEVLPPNRTRLGTATLAES